jgi:hypothetical protein
MLDFDPSPSTVGLKCSLNDRRQVVHAGLKALEFFGDQQAAVLVKMLERTGTQAPPDWKAL